MVLRQEITSANLWWFVHSGQGDGWTCRFPSASTLVFFINLCDVNDIIILNILGKSSKKEKEKTLGEIKREKQKEKEKAKKGMILFLGNYVYVQIRIVVILMLTVFLMILMQNFYFTCNFFL